MPRLSKRYARAGGRDGALHVSRKFELYRSIESPGEYLLVCSDRVQADLYTRQPDGRWLLTSASGVEASLDLQSVGCRIGLGDLYEKVDLSPAPGRVTSGFSA